MGAGVPSGLQNRCDSLAGLGGFDSHTLPPLPACIFQKYSGKIHPQPADWNRVDWLKTAFGKPLVTWFTKKCLNKYRYLK